jgi:hypothetical protein
MRPRAVKTAADVEIIQSCQMRAIARYLTAIAAQTTRKISKYSEIWLIGSIQYGKLMPLRCVETFDLQLLPWEDLRHLE